MSALVAVNPALADPVTATVPDAPAREPAHPSPVFLPSSDLDGIYVWLGPVGAASRIAGQWDSTFGAALSVIRVREHAPLGVIGGSFGGSLWTARRGGRLWLDAVAGTRIVGRMAGLTAGPFVELSDEAHPKLGASVGAWAFVGLTPYVRAGAVEGLGGFVELGIQLALPVFRR